MSRITENCCIVCDYNQPPLRSSTDYKMGVTGLDPVICYQWCQGALAQISWTLIRVFL